MVLFQHNIEALIWQRLAAGRSSSVGRWFFRRQHRRMQQWEARLSSIFDGVVTVSPEDAELARSEYGLTNVLGHVPTGVDSGAFKPAPPLAPGLSPTVGFLGAMDWMPNIEGVLWFVREVLPLVRQRVPGTRFKIIGRNPPPSIRALATAESGIEVTGTVDDVQPHVHGCNLIVVPLLSGGGTRIKIFECMAMGVAVVSTTIGAEGLPSWRERICKSPTRSERLPIPSPNSCRIPDWRTGWRSTRANGRSVSLAGRRLHPDSLPCARAYRRCQPVFRHDDSRADQSSRVVGAGALEAVAVAVRASDEMRLPWRWGSGWAWRFFAE